MSARSFRSVFMVASCAGAALGCYLVSLRVASERAALESVETQIVLAQRDIRLLQTEIGTRGRLAQLERWNVKVLALSAPTADQFVEGGFALASLVTPKDKVDLAAPVVLAAAPAKAPQPHIEGTQQQPQRGSEDAVSVGKMLHVASLKRDIRQAADRPVEKPKPDSAAKAPGPAERARARSASAEKEAAADPLAPLGTAAKPNKLASTSKDSGQKQ